MPAYIIVQATVTNPEGFAEYAKRTPAVVAKHGGRYLAKGRDVEALEGAWDHQSVVISEWPSMDAARAFWRSDDYEALKQTRAGALEATVLLVNGV